MAPHSRDNRAAVGKERPSYRFHSKGRVTTKVLAIADVSGNLVHFRFMPGKGIQTRGNTGLQSRPEL